MPLNLDSTMTDFARANNIAGVFIRLINGWFLERIPHKIRIVVNTVAFSGGIVLVALAPDFIGAIAGIVIVGAACSFGESVILGYLQNYPSELVGGWSSGTGMAGFAGSLLYLALASSSLNLTGRFLVTLPTCAIYVLVFLFALAPPKVFLTRAGAGFGAVNHEKPTSVVIRDTAEADSKLHEESPLLSGVESERSMHAPVSPTTSDTESTVVGTASATDEPSAPATDGASVPAPAGFSRASCMAGLRRSLRSLKLV